MAADYYCRKSGPQIPAFGDWENANELPITQYFECARQAGFLRCSCSRECGGPRSGDYHQKALPRRVNEPPQRMTRDMNKDRKHSNEQRKQDKMRDHNKYEEYQPRNLASQKSSISIKPVDEDLYKIPSELLENSKRKKMLGFFSRCIVPPCT
ncbi:hypothetical protein ACJIZ3_008709 [Penstemon smallii]|uniref:Uncharacterized protein n=1 Tax=Penstemon smallii TaxID=265156 RepID=A0ABD3TCN0_9LAMI